MTQSKFAYIYQSNQSFAQVDETGKTSEDKQDQILKINHNPPLFLSRFLLEKDDQGKSYLKSKSINVEGKTYLCWIVDLFQTSFFKQHFIVIFNDSEIISAGVFQQLGITEYKNLIAKVAAIRPSNGIFSASNRDNKNKQTQNSSFINPVNSIINSIKSKFNSKDGLLKIEHKPKADFQAIYEMKELDDKDKKDTKAQFKAQNKNSLERIADFLKFKIKLTKKDFDATYCDESLLIKLGNLAFLGKLSEEDFQKYVLIFTLAHSYLDSLKKASKQLVSAYSSKNQTQLAERYQNCLDFAIQFIFDSPVVVNQEKLVNFWQEVMVSLELNEAKIEFNTKLGLVKDALKEQRHKLKALGHKNSLIENRKHLNLKKKNISKINTKISIIGVLLVLIGLVNLTPFSFYNFAHSWYEYWIGMLSKF